MERVGNHFIVWVCFLFAVSFVFLAHVTMFPDLSSSLGEYGIIKISSNLNNRTVAKLIQIISVFTYFHTIAMVMVWLGSEDFSYVVQVRQQLWLRFREVLIVITKKCFLSKLQFTSIEAVHFGKRMCTRMTVLRCTIGGKNAQYDNRLAKVLPIT